MRTEHEELKRELENLTTKLKDWFSPSKKAETFNYSLFSDSILIVDESTRKGFNRISKVAAGLMRVSLEHKFPIKGAISKGLFTYDEGKQLFFGRAIVDAFLLQEQVHYYGIVAHHSMEEDIREYANGWDDGNTKKTKQTPEAQATSQNSETMNNRRNPYVLSPTPLKNGNITHYHLAYNLISAIRQTGVNVDDAHNKLVSWLEVISGTVSGAPRIYVDKTLEVLTRDLSMFKEAEAKGLVSFPLSK